MQEKQPNLSDKRLERQQNKKRKLEAFFTIALMNDKQRAANYEKLQSNEPDVKKKKKSASLNHIRRKEAIAAMEKTKNSSEEKEKKPLIDGKEFIKLKVALSARKKLLKSQPRFWLHELGLKASLSLSPDERIPLFLGDVQHLVLLSVVGNTLHREHNRWFHLDRHGKISHVMVLLLEGVGAGDFTKPLKFQTEGKSIQEIFPHQVELVNPQTYDRTLADDFSLVPLSARLCRSMLLKYGSKEAELKSRVFRAAFPIGVAVERTATGELVDKPEESKTSEEGDAEEKKKKKETEKSKEDPSNGNMEKQEKSKPPKSKEVYHCLHPADKFPRTELLLSPSQMVEEGYAIPIGEMAYRYKNYVYSKDHYAQVTPVSPMFGLDCEMCMTTARCNELTRVSIVDENHQPVYETLVMPYNKITNYLTQYSGITKKMMIGVKTRIEDVQEDIRRILPPDAILVGQSLNCDLHALKIYHPYVIDSSVVFNINHKRKMKTKLKTMMALFLGEQIQNHGSDGHDSIEDSIAALKLVQFKLSKSLSFGDTVLGFKMEEAKLHVPGKFNPADVAKEKEEEEKEEDYKNVPADLPQPEVLKVMEASSLFKLIARTKKAAVFTTPTTLPQYTKYLSGHHELSGAPAALRVGSHGFTADTCYKAAKLMMKEGAKFDLSVGHLTFDARVQKERARAVNTCLKMAETLQENGLLLIVAGGRPIDNTDGRPEHRPACFVHLKSPSFIKL